MLPIYYNKSLLLPTVYILKYEVIAGDVSAGHVMCEVALCVNPSLLLAHSMRSHCSMKCPCPFRVVWLVIEYEAPN